MQCSPRSAAKAAIDLRAEFPPPEKLVTSRPLHYSQKANAMSSMMLSGLTVSDGPYTTSSQLLQILEHLRKPVDSLSHVCDARAVQPAIGSARSPP
jgi:hypothetical protein